MVFTRIGQKLAHATIKIFISLPTPKRRMTIGIKHDSVVSDNESTGNPYDYTYTISSKHSEKSYIVMCQKFS
jgi:hypothetical protein